MLLIKMAIGDLFIQQINYLNQVGNFHIWPLLLRRKILLTRLQYINIILNKDKTYGEWRLHFSTNKNFGQGWTLNSYAFSAFET